VEKGREEIDVARAVVAELLHAEVESERAVVALSSDARLTRTGRVVRLVHRSGNAATASQPDRPLIRLLVQALQWWTVQREGDVNITELAAREEVTTSWMTWCCRSHSCRGRLSRQCARRLAAES
jgi:uncharacterized protein with gpF-like domain